MPAQLYMGEAAGARVIRYGTEGVTRVTTAGTQVVNIDIDSWDVTPLGVIGDSLFRLVGGVVRYTNGFDIEVTPYVDGVAKDPQRFTQGGEGEYAIEAFIAQRGARLRLRVRTLNRAGAIELDQWVVSYYPLRLAP